VQELHDYVSEKVGETQSDMTPKFISLDEDGDIKLTKCPIDPIHLQIHQFQR
jgi:hypothetical protein